MKMKNLVARSTLLTLLVITLGLVLSQVPVTTAKPNDTSVLFLPYVSKILPTPTPIPVKPIKLGPVGTSTGGDYFEDGVPATSKVAYVYVRAGDLVDSVQIFLDTGALLVHGTSGANGGGTLYTLHLVQGEYITEVFGRAGEVVDQIGIKTNLRTWGPWGGTGGDAYSMKAPDNYEIVGFWGYSGLFLDHLGALARQRQ